MIVNKTKQAADRWLRRSKIKLYMTTLEYYENMIAQEVHKNNIVELSYCSIEDDINYVTDYEKSDEMDSVIMMLLKEKVYYT
jgi:hypothetical protein